MTENVAVVLVDLICCKLKDINNEYEALKYSNIDIFSLLTGENPPHKGKLSAEIEEKIASLRHRAKKYFGALKDINEEYPDDSKERRELFEKLAPSLLHIYDEVFKERKDD